MTTMTNHEVAMRLRSINDRLEFALRGLEESVHSTEVSVKSVEESLQALER